MNGRRISPPWKLPGYQHYLKEAEHRYQQHTGPDEERFFIKKVTAEILLISPDAFFPATHGLVGSSEDHTVLWREEKRVT